MKNQLLKWISSSNDISLLSSNSNYALKWLLYKSKIKHEYINYALIEQAENDNIPSVKILIKSGADASIDYNRVLRLASIRGQMSLIKFLIKYGVDIHAHDDEILHMASEYGNLSVVKFLVKSIGYKADINEALCWASLKGHLSIVKFLVKSGADISTFDNLALRWAKSHGHSSIVKFLKSC